MKLKEIEDINNSASSTSSTDLDDNKSEDNVIISTSTTTTSTMNANFNDTKNEIEIHSNSSSPQHHHKMENIELDNHISCCSSNYCDINGNKFKMISDAVKSNFDNSNDSTTDEDDDLFDVYESKMAPHE